MWGAGWGWRWGCGCVCVFLIVHICKIVAFKRAVICIIAAHACFFKSILQQKSTYDSPFWTLKGQRGALLIRKYVLSFWEQQI
jgi:hypothetical protein